MNILIALIIIGMDMTEIKLVNNDDKKERLTRQLTVLKNMLVFAANTSYDPSEYKSGSKGHCAVCAVIVNYIWGGDVVSATIKGESHWFNKIGNMYCDITGDQFGYPSIQVEKDLYPKVTKRVRVDFGDALLHRVQTLVKTSLRGMFDEI